MTKKYAGGLVLGLLVATVLACGDDDDQSLCDDAWEKWCACDKVSCDGHPTSCTGPDREWAQCVMDAEDACTAMCD